MGEEGGHDPAYNSTATRQHGGVKYAWERTGTRGITWAGLRLKINRIIPETFALQGMEIIPGVSLLSLIYNRYPVIVIFSLIDRISRTCMNIEC